jgi:hypothetical protein
MPDNVYKIGKAFNSIKIYLLSLRYTSLDVTNTVLLLMYEKVYGVQHT